MINKFKPKSEFFRNVLTLITGTSIAQAIPIAISPILTRIYSPEDFGIFALFYSIASVFSVVATGRYEMAIILPKKDEDAINILTLSIIIAFFVSVLIFALIIIFNLQITALLGNPDISDWLYFIPVTILLTGFYQSFNYWVIRKRKYRLIASNRVVRTATSGLSNLGFGYSGFGAGGMILSSIISHGVATFILVKKSLNNNKLDMANISISDVKRLANKYKKFPIYNTQHVLINTVFAQMPIFILSKYFLVASVGFYSLSIRIVKTPITILGSSFATVLYEKTTYLRNKNEKFMVQIYKFIKTQIVLGVFLFTGIFFVSNYMDVIFGDSWIEVGLYIKLLIPWLFMVFVVSPLAFSINLTNNQEKGLTLEWVYGLLKLGSLLLGVLYFEDIKFTLIIYSIANALFLVYQGFWFVNLLKKEEL